MLSKALGIQSSARRKGGRVTRRRRKRKRDRQGTIGEGEKGEEDRARG